VNRGVTLLELLLAMTVMAIAAGVTALGWRSATESPAARVMAELEAARGRAVRAARAERWEGPGGSVWFWPDGSATPVRLSVDGVVVVVDPLTGSVRAER